MPRFAVAVRQTIEYEIEVDAATYDGAVKAAQERAKNNLVPIKKAIRVPHHNDDDLMIQYVAHRHDEG